MCSRSGADFNFKTIIALHLWLENTTQYFLTFSTGTGFASLQQSVPRQKPADHVFAEDVTASDPSYEPSLRTLQNLQGPQSDEIRAKDEEDARGFCLSGEDDSLLFKVVIQEPR